MHGPPRAPHARTRGPRRRPRGSLAAPAAGDRAWTLGTVALQCENARAGQIEVRAVPAAALGAVQCRTPHSKSGESKGAKISAQDGSRCLPPVK